MILWFLKNNKICGGVKSKKKILCKKTASAKNPKSSYRGSKSPSVEGGVVLNFREGVIKNRGLHPLTPPCSPIVVPYFPPLAPSNKSNDKKTNHWFDFLQHDPCLSYRASTVVWNNWDILYGFGRYIVTAAQAYLLALILKLSASLVVCLKLLLHKCSAFFRLSLQTLKHNTIKINENLTFL